MWKTCGLLVLSTSHDLTATVVSAFEVYTVVKCRLSSYRIKVIGAGFQLEMRSTLVATGFGDFSLRMGHFILILLCWQK